LGIVGWNVAVMLVITWFFYAAGYRKDQLLMFHQNQKKRDILIHSVIWGFAIIDSVIVLLSNGYGFFDFKI